MTWLRDQLPRVMMQDPFLYGVAGIAEALGGSVRDGIDSIEHQLDVTLASPRMLSYLASWLGMHLDPDGDAGQQRELVRAIGPLLGRRGTVRGLEELLQALTGGRARVSDGGGVYIDARDVPPADHRIVVQLDDLGPLTAQQIDAFIAAEVPVGTTVQVVTGRSMTPTGSGPARHGPAGLHT